MPIHARELYDIVKVGGVSLCGTYPSLEPPIDHIGPNEISSMFFAILLGVPLICYLAPIILD